MSGNILDTSQAKSLAPELTTLLIDEIGCSVEEGIPALVQAVIELADGDDALLDAAANLLADGGV